MCFPSPFFRHFILNFLTLHEYFRHIAFQLRLRSDCRSHRCLEWSLIWSICFLRNICVRLHTRHQNDKSHPLSLGPDIVKFRTRLSSPDKQFRLCKPVIKYEKAGKKEIGDKKWNTLKAKNKEKEKEKEPLTYSLVGWRIETRSTFPHHSCWSVTNALRCTYETWCAW